MAYSKITNLLKWINQQFENEFKLNRNALISLSEATVFKNYQDRSTDNE